MRKLLNCLVRSVLLRGTLISPSGKTAGVRGSPRDMPLQFTKGFAP